MTFCANFVLGTTGNRRSYQSWAQEAAVLKFENIVYSVKIATKPAIATNMHLLLNIRA